VKRIRFVIEARDVQSKKLFMRSDITHDAKTPLVLTSAAAGRGGRGQTLSLTLTPGAVAPVRYSNKHVTAHGDLVQLDFSEPMPLTSLIKPMAQVRNKAIVLARDLNATVQLVTPEPVTREQAFAEFVKALHAAGLDVVEEEKMIRIVAKDVTGGVAP
jgi:hypothetical protein